jgi:hypothetical protein
VKPAGFERPAESEDDPLPPILPEDAPKTATSAEEPATPAAAFRPPVVAGEDVVEDVASLFINPFHTTGIDLDQQPGDDAIRVLFEPRGASGRFIPKTGSATLVLIDPAKEGEDGRVARWELSPREIGEGILEARPQRGVRLELPWPSAPPENSKLKLFVRYQGATGQPIEASSDVAITLPGQAGQRWTPRSVAGTESQPR